MKTVLIKDLTQKTKVVASKFDWHINYYKE